MDPSPLSATYSTPWYIALVDELVDGLRQTHPDANWTNLPTLTSEVFVAKPHVLYVRAASCTSASAQTHSGNANSNGSGNSNNSNGNGSNNSSDSSKSGNNTTLIAAVAGAVGGCLLLAGIIFFLYRRHLKRKHAAPQTQPPAPNPTLLDSTPLAGGKTQPMQFQGGPMAMATPPSTYVPSSSGDSSSQYNYTAPLSPQWTGTTGMTGAISTHLGHPPPSLHPSTYYTTSPTGPYPMTSSSSVSGPAPWAVPMDPNLQAHPQAYLSPILAPGPSPLPGMEKAQFSGYAVPGHQNTLPAWAVDHKRPQSLSPPPNSAVGASGSGTGAPLSNVLEQPGDALPPPAYSATPSSL